MADRRIVVLNTGSSSLKFAVYPGRPEAPAIQSGAVEGIGGKPRLRMKDSDGKATEHPVDAADPSAALDALLALQDGPLSGDIAAFGHRIVHGGPSLDRR
jgi:acetate kinase